MLTIAITMTIVIKRGVFSYLLVTWAVLIFEINELLFTLMDVSLSGKFPKSKAIH